MKVGVDSEGLEEVEEEEEEGEEEAGGEGGVGVLWEKWLGRRGKGWVDMRKNDKISSQVESKDRREKEVFTSCWLAHSIVQSRKNIDSNCEKFNLHFMHFDIRNK